MAALQARYTDGPIPGRGRFRGRSGHAADIVDRSKLTHTCQSSADFAVMHNASLLSIMSLDRRSRP